MTATETNGSLQATVDDFFCKAIPEPVQILGLKLLPLSIGRYRRMARHGVGFVSEKKVSADGKDLILGVLICSMPCRTWDELSTSEILPKIVNQWFNQIQALPPFYLRGSIGKIISASFIGKWWRKHNSFDLYEKCKLFKRYIEDAQVIPRYISKQQSSSKSASHWSHSIEVALRSQLNWDSQDIEEAPLSKALADYFKHLENEGLITILTEQDFQQIKANNEILERAISAHEAKKHADAKKLADSLIESLKGGNHGL
jgi:hypothetical protein